MFDEDYDDWEDDDDNDDVKTFSRESNPLKPAIGHFKRPLEAISLRQPKNLQTTQQNKLPYGKESKNEDWPDETDFKVQRWQRTSEKDYDTPRDQFDHLRQSKSRNLPRSRRRRV